MEDELMELCVLVQYSPVLSKAAVDQGILAYIDKNYDQYPQWSCLLLSFLVRNGQQSAVFSSGLLDTVFDTVVQSSTSPVLLLVCKSMLEDMVNDGFVSALAILSVCARRLGRIDYMYH